MTDVRSRTVTAELAVWDFASQGSQEWAAVRLPHDAMIGERRTPDADGGPDTGYFPGGKYTYRTVWAAPHEPLPFVALRFDGVQGEATVDVNGVRVGSLRSGYTEFELPFHNALRWGADNEIVVSVDNSAQPNGRWYPGSGLYRRVQIIAGPATRFAPDGVRLRTRTLTPGFAVLDVDYRLTSALQRSHEAAEAAVMTELRAYGVTLASAESKGPSGSVTLRVEDPRAWTAESPNLYELVSRVQLDGITLDERRELVGLRTISVDARRGLQINGQTVKLRGACIHHDNGLLGAATHRAAEYRRVRLLKEAGFNALRSAHNPMSRDMLDACDEIGMYVLDELADYWTVSKTTHDYAYRFRDTWREDADRMVEKDRNRASVIMYASGNEIPETATPEGAFLARTITDYLHRLDPDRPVTVAVNLFLNTLVSIGKSPYNERPGAETSMAGSTEANVMINQIGRMMDVVSRLPRADRASRDAFAAVDVAGYNYGLGRYRRDARAYPERVILGSETLPGDVARAWHLTQELDAVIGDFVWAGWEYLGEAGVSVWVPGKRAGLSKPYPYIVSGPGMFDLTGIPDITLRLAQAAWGLLDAPAIGVRPVNLSGIPMVRSAWRKTDAVESWSWRGCEGRKADIEVYSDADVVELFLNDRPVGRRKAGRKRGYVARFATPYEPGRLTAIAYRGGAEVARTSLSSAQNILHMRLDPESPFLRADGDDLLFIQISLADEFGVTEMLADELIQVRVDGPGELVGLGTAAPSTQEQFTASSCTTFRGRALAVIRSTGGEGHVTVTVHSESVGEARVTVEALQRPPLVEDALPISDGSAAT